MRSLAGLDARRVAAHSAKTIRADKVAAVNVDGKFRAKGRTKEDKRHAIAARDVAREVERELGRQRKYGG